MTTGVIIATATLTLIVFAIGWACGNISATPSSPFDLPYIPSRPEFENKTFEMAKREKEIADLKRVNELLTEQNGSLLRRGCYGGCFVRPECCHRYPVIDVSRLALVGEGIWEIKKYGTEDLVPRQPKKK